jgi:Photosynthesis system II assembly factor YCF48/Putative zinc-finger
MDNFAKLVSGRLKTQPASPHPNPDLLTSFAENALSKEERKQLLKHLGTCSDCRQTLFFALPDSAESQKVLAVGPKRVSRLALRWGTLAASAAIVGFLFTAHYSTRKSANLPAANQAVQIAAEKTPPDIDHLAMGGKATEAKQEQPAETKARPPAKHMTAKPQASLAFDSSGQVRVRSAPAPENEVSLRANDVSSANEKPAAPASNTLSPQIDGRDAPKSANESAEISGSASAPAEKQSTAELDLKKAAPLADSGRANAASAPAQSAQWMISPQGSLQRSDDSGETWQIVPVQPGASFRAFSTAGTEVWVAGNGGNLYHSSDSGRNWGRVEPTAAGHKLRAEIISVNFSDPLNGALTTENGEVWTTSDGGKSWALK